MGKERGKIGLFVFGIWRGAMDDVGSY